MPKVPVIRPSDTPVPGVGKPAQLQGTRLDERSLDSGQEITAGGHLLSNALERLGETAENIRREDDVFTARERLSQARRELADRTRSASDAPFNWTGSRSTEILGAVREAHEEVGARARDGLSAGALEVFGEEWDQEGQSYSLEASRVQAHRRREWQDQVLERDLEDAVSMGMRDPVGQPSLVGQGYAHGVDALRLHSIVNGVAEEDFAAKVQDFTSAYYANIINAASLTDPTTAAVYLSSYGDKLSPKHRAEVDKALRPLFMLQQGQRRVDSIIGEVTDPASGNVDWEAANEKARGIESAEMREEVLGQISRRRERDAAAKRMNEAQRREYDWSALNKILDVGNPAAISVDDAEKIVRSQNDPATRDAMQKRLDEAIRGRDIVTDPRAYEELNNIFLRATTTGDFTQVRPEYLSLANWSDRVSPSDLKRFYTWQKDLMDPTTRQAVQLNAQSASAAANAIVKRLGINEKTETGKQRADSVRYAYQLALEDALRRKQEREGVRAKLTATEQAEVDRSFIQQRYEETAVFFHDQESLANLIPFEEWDDVAAGVREEGWPVTPETMLLYSEYLRESGGQSPRVTRAERARLLQRLEQLGVRKVK